MSSIIYVAIGFLLGGSSVLVILGCVVLWRERHG